MSLSRWLRLSAVCAGAALVGCTGDIAGVSSPTEATQLVFIVQPGGAVAGAAIAPAVEVGFVDNRGNPVTNITADITVAIGTDSNGGTLAGDTTVPAVNGVATFSTLSVSRAGAAYTLTASTPSLPVATSGEFNVSAAAASALRHDAPTPR